MPRTVHITAPSRLHFGLWSLGSSSGRQFGGVGAMVERPGLKLTIAEDQTLVSTGRLSMRAVQAAHRWAQFHQRPPPLVRIRLIESPPEHAGLGTGTQLGLAVAAGLNALFGLPSQTPQELAISAGRGLRSAVGTYGFVHGGLIVDQGKLSGEPISPLDCRLDLPADWRFVLVRPKGLKGLAGEEEAEAMAALPPVPQEVTEELIAEARERLVPAAATGQFDAFARSLHAYGRRAGECFAARQGGPYNGPVLTQLVERIRRLGYEGVGQSSWGPTLFAVAKDTVSAERLAEQVRSGQDAADLELAIAAPCNRGAEIRLEE
jgi:beta-ribofuranosylaminobenzene 5'-phosphate synthase